jgi:hypothetical protein
MKSMRPGFTLVLFALTAASVRLAAQSNPPTPPRTAPAAPISAAPVSAAPAPMIQAEAVFDFGKAALGEKVRHSYMVTNTGNATLTITSVRPGCHCTTVGDWTHDIAPGSNGQVTVQFDTTSTGRGGPVVKTIQIESNAKNDPHKMVMLKGTVWQPIEVTPNISTINIPADSSNEVSSTVRIVNNTDNPVAFSNALCTNQLFRVALKETKPGKEYQLVITAVPPFPLGYSQGTVTVNTSYPDTPTVSMTAIASITPAVQIYPTRLIVNSRPERWITNTITIHGNTTNLLLLSNLKSSDSRIQVEIRPLAGAGAYSLLVAFPPGFHLAPGQQAEVTVESNHPRFPLI